MTVSAFPKDAHDKMQVFREFRAFAHPGVLLRCPALSCPVEFVVVGRRAAAPPARLANATSRSSRPLLGLSLADHYIAGVLVFQFTGTD